MVLADDISINPSKIEVVLERQRPKTAKEVKSFLGLVGYYKRFVEEVAKLA